MNQTLKLGPALNGAAGCDISIRVEQNIFWHIGNQICEAGDLRLQAFDLILFC